MHANRRTSTDGTLVCRTLNSHLHHGQLRVAQSRLLRSVASRPDWSSVSTAIAVHGYLWLTMKAGAAGQETICNRSKALILRPHGCM
jgi:hypothetical protein